MKFLFTLVGAFFLSGCILQSPAPNFSEADGKPLFGKNGGTFLSYEFSDGKWNTDGKDIRIVAVGQHYELADVTDVTKMVFIPLGGPWWFAQTTEASGKSAYGIVRVKGAEFYLFALACSKLKNNVAAIPFVDFEKDDCLLAPNTEVQKLVNLVEDDSQHQMKLVPKK